MQKQTNSKNHINIKYASELSYTKDLAIQWQRKSKATCFSLYRDLQQY